MSRANSISSAESSIQYGVEAMRRLWPALGIILSLALLIRLVFVLIIPQPENAIGDSAEFDLLARNLLAGHGLSYGEPWLPSARRTPLYPWLLATCYRLFGVGSATPLLLLQALADTATVALVAWLAWRAWASPRVGLLAALGWALYLPGAQLAGRLLADSLFTFLLAAGVSLFVATSDALGRDRVAATWPRRALPLAACSGLVLGLAALARPTALPLAALLAALLVGWSLWPRRPSASFRPQAAASHAHRTLLVAVTLVAASLLVLLPWFVRSYRAFGRLVTGSTLVGFNFYQTHYRLDQPDYTDLPGVQATSAALKAALRAEGIEPAALNEVQLYDEAMRLGMEQVRRHPDRFLHLAALRTIQLWFNLGFTAHPSTATLLFASVNAALLLLALLAEIRWLRRWPGSLAFVHAAAILILLYFTAGHAAIIAAGRYIIPALPFLVVLASGVVARALSVSSD